MKLVYGMMPVQLGTTFKGVQFATDREGARRAFADGKQLGKLAYHQKNHNFGTMNLMAGGRSTSITGRNLPGQAKVAIGTWVQPHPKDASDFAAYRRRAVMTKTRNYSDKKFGGMDRNTVNHHLRSARSGGTVAPAKKGANTTFKTGANCC